MMTETDVEFDYGELMPEDGSMIGLPFPSPRVLIPERVTLVAKSGERWLEYLWDESSDRRKRYSPPPRQMLEPFIEIAHDDAGDPEYYIGYRQKALAFASRFGPLGICRLHNFSCWHLRPPCPMSFMRKGKSLVTRERLIAWYIYSRLARAILNLVAKPNAPARQEDLKKLKVFFGPRVVGPGTAVNMWLGACHFRCALRGEPPRLRVLPSPHGLAQLGIQLALLVNRQNAVAVCDSCGDAFSPKRHPRGDRRSYCNNCGTKGRWRDAQRRRRAKLRNGKK